MNDRKLNLIIGWICFLISFIVYYLTAEPTVGFWDTGEYITTSAKLQVGHPPGAPLYQMLGAIFSIFAFERKYRFYNEFNERICQRTCHFIHVLVNNTNT